MLHYDGASQQLVDRGELKPDAADAVVKFALSRDGEYSEKIPTGINAYDTYEVWYIVEGANNYEDIGKTLISDVKILPKELDDPVVQLEYDTILYDGGFKEPRVTVIDKDGWTTLPSTEYAVTYSNNQYVSTDDKPAVVTVTDIDGNYKLFPTESGSGGKRDFYFKITASDQSALHITNMPNTTITYGDEFTLGTSGGSGSGTVTWAITKVIDGAGNLIYSADAGTDALSAEDIVELDEHSGHIKIKGPGEITVQATKSGANVGGNNFADATAEWTFTAVQKHVVAVVTADNKTYDGDTKATVHAAVPEQERVPGDIIDIEVTGGFDNENAGKNKTVTVYTNQAKITLNGVPMQVANTSPYNITFTSDSNTVTADIDKADLVVSGPERNTTS